MTDIMTMFTMFSDTIDLPIRILTGLALPCNTILKRIIGWGGLFGLLYMLYKYVYLTSNGLFRIWGIYLLATVVFWIGVATINLLINCSSKRGLNNILFASMSNVFIFTVLLTLFSILFKYVPETIYTWLVALYVVSHILGGIIDELR